MGGNFFDRGEVLVRHYDWMNRRTERHIKTRWLWIVGLIGFLLPGVCPPFSFFWAMKDSTFILQTTFFSNWPYPQLFTWGMPLDYWLKALSVYTTLALGTTSSAVLLWHSIAHKARYPGWKSGMGAGVLANLVSYPLTGIVFIWFNIWASSPPQSNPDQIGALLSGIAIGILYGLIGLVIYGLFTTPVSLVLGALCGWLEGWELQRSMSKRLKY
jgi:hypothetical protein